MGYIHRFFILFAVVAVAGVSEAKGIPNWNLDYDEMLGLAEVENTLSERRSTTVCDEFSMSASTACERATDPASSPLVKSLCDFFRQQTEFWCAVGAPSTWTQLAATFAGRPHSSVVFTQTNYLLFMRTKSLSFTSCFLLGLTFPSCLRPEPCQAAANLHLLML